METNNEPDAEFKTLVTRVLNELRGKVLSLSNLVRASTKR